MAQPARRRRAVDDETPSLDPSAIERNYVRERARRRARVERKSSARRSDARFWFMLVALTLLTVFVALTAWHEVQKIFGV